MSLEINNLLDSKDVNNFLFENTSSALFIVSKNLKIKQINNTFRTMFANTDFMIQNQIFGDAMGCSSAIEENKTCNTASDCVRCSIIKSIQNSFLRVNDVQSSHFARKFIINKNTTMKYFKLVSKHIIINGEDLVLVSLDDITEREENKNMMKELSNRDLLTGLFTRKYLFEIGEKFFENAKRGSFTIAIAIFDIDDLKKINDLKGYSVGDELIQSISKVMLHNVRKADVVTRYGSDEFCLLFIVKNNTNIYQVVEKIRKKVQSESGLLNKEKISLTISAGICTKMDETFDRMVKKTEQMLFSAKKKGKNTVIIDDNKAIIK